MRTRNECPLCGAPADAARHFAKTAKGYDLFECPCGLVYGKEYYDEDKIFSIYNEEYARGYERPELVNLIRSYADRFFGKKERGRLLEVGCGNGHLLRRLDELGFTVRGVEVGESLAARCRDLDVKVMPFEEMRVPPPVARFDYVVTFHVLEHIVEPVPAVQKIAKMLKPEGVWFNYKPNVRAWRPEAHGPGWIHFDPTNAAEHINFFDEKTIRVLAEKAGLEVYLVEAENDDFWSEARLRGDNG
ncbi:MAG: class I SAM-dependent methyltransferase [Candidatus Zixiibacteriota bacterium]|jgi:SAM-dependent methyltransferase